MCSINGIFWVQMCFAPNLEYIFPLHIFIIFEEMGKELKDLTMDSP